MVLWKVLSLDSRLMCLFLNCFFGIFLKLGICFSVLVMIFVLCWVLWGV